MKKLLYFSLILSALTLLPWRSVAALQTDVFPYGSVRLAFRQLMCSCTITDEQDFLAAFTQIDSASVLIQPHSSLKELLPNIDFHAFIMDTGEFEYYSGSIACVAAISSTNPKDIRILTPQDYNKSLSFFDLFIGQKPTNKEATCIAIAQLQLQAHSRFATNRIAHTKTMEIKVLTNEPQISVIFSWENVYPNSISYEKPDMENYRTDFYFKNDSLTAIDVKGW